MFELLSGTGFTPCGSPCAWAYLDPGTGSMLFQVVIAGLLSTLFCAKSAWLGLRSTWHGLGGREKGSSTP